MKVKVTDQILDYKGKPILDKDENEKDIPMTWRSIVFMSLQNFTRDEQQGQIPTDTKIKCHIITERVFSSDEPDLTAEDRTFILDRIGKIIINPLIVGRAKDVFEDKKEEEKKS